MAKFLGMFLQVEEVAFGRVFRSLRDMSGVVSIELEGKQKGAAPAAPKRPKGKTSEGTTNQCIVLFALQKENLHRKELEAQLVATGRKASSLNGLLGKMTKAKLIKAHGEGIYAITASGNKFVNTSCPVQE